jgi:hypothetical protein
MILLRSLKRVEMQNSLNKGGVAVSENDIKINMTLAWWVFVIVEGLLILCFAGGSVGFVRWLLSSGAITLLFCALLKGLANLDNLLILLRKNE